MLLFPNRKGNKFRFGWHEHDKQMDRIRVLNEIARAFQLQAALIDSMLDTATYCRLVVCCLRLISVPGPGTIRAGSSITWRCR